MCKVLLALKGSNSSQMYNNPSPYLNWLLMINKVLLHFANKCSNAINLICGRLYNKNNHSQLSTLKQMVTSIFANS